MHKPTCTKGGRIHTPKHRHEPSRSRSLLIKSWHSAQARAPEHRKPAAIVGTQHAHTHAHTITRNSTLIGEHAGYGQVKGGASLYLAVNEAMIISGCFTPRFKKNKIKNPMSKRVDIDRTGTVNPTTCVSVCASVDEQSRQHPFFTFDYLTSKKIKVLKKQQKDPPLTYSARFYHRSSDLPRRASLLSFGYFKFFFSLYFRAHAAPQFCVPAAATLWSVQLRVIQVWRQRPKQDSGDGADAIHQRDRGGGNPSDSKSLRRPPNSDSPPVTVVRVHELSARSPQLWGDRYAVGVAEKRRRV